MKIKISNLSDGFHDFEQEEIVQKYGLTEPFTDKINLKVNVDKSDSQIVFNCSFFVKLHFTCDRCLDEFESEIQDNFKIIYLSNAEDEILDSDNVYSLKYEQVEIDLTQDFLDYINLSIPKKNLCDEECKGLCSHCGANLNYESCKCESQEVNPIWKDLLKIKFDDNKEN
jgi:uncharacterized protein